jgi:hypothetical protein
MEMKETPVAGQQLVVDRPDLSDAGRPFYANVAHVAYTPFDFRLTFSLLASPRDGADLDPLLPEERPDVVAEIVIPVAAVDSLTDLLGTALASYQEHFGAPGPQVRQVSA